MVASSGARISPEFASTRNVCTAVFLHNLQCPERRLAGHLFAPVVIHKRDSHVPRGFLFLHTSQTTLASTLSVLPNVAWPDTIWTVAWPDTCGHIWTFAWLDTCGHIWTIVCRTYPQCILALLLSVTCTLACKVSNFRWCLKFGGARSGACSNTWFPDVGPNPCSYSYLFVFALPSPLLLHVILKCIAGLIVHVHPCTCFFVACALFS